MSHNQGEIALLWKENHGEYEVKLACVIMPNILTLKLVTGDEQFYCMGMYIPPTDMIEVEDLWTAWEACPAGCTPIVLGDLNIILRDPRNKQEEIIVNLLDNINIVNMSPWFVP